MRPLFKFGAVFWLTLWWVGMAMAMPNVSGVRFGTDGERTRVVIDVLPSVEVNARTVASPPRLVIDLPAVEWGLADGAQSRPRGYAKSFRYGAVNESRSRLVVDLVAEVRIAHQEVLPAGFGGVPHARIVIDLEPDRQNTEPRGNAPADNKVAALPPTLRPKAKPVQPVRQNQSRIISRQASLPVIAIDAGHGGIDPGAIAADGTFEKHITLAMAREVAELLTVSRRYRPFLVRKDDTFIKLRERIARARKANADIFISIHADSIEDSGFRGASVYTLSENASDKEAANLAAKENKADIIGGADLSNADEVLASILIDLSQRATNNESIAFADFLVDEVGQVTKLVKNTRRFAGFAVLKSPDLPSVLVELGYLSNTNDAERLKKQSHRIELGQAILKALDRYFENRNNDG